MGSRAKLADVPKLHELITHQVTALMTFVCQTAHLNADIVFQIRRVLLEKGTWKIVLPGLSSVSEVKEDIKRDREMADQSAD